MTTVRLPEDFKDEHVERIGRKVRGRSRAGGTNYSYRVACSCGWEAEYRVNGTRRDAEQVHRGHMIEEWGRTA